MRRRILDAALEVFAQSGYRSGSLREIATRVGMSEAGLLHHFPSKIELLREVLAHRDVRADRIVDRGGDDGLATLAGVIELARLNATEPGAVEIYCVLSAEATTPDHPAHEFFVERYASLRASMTTTFERLQADGRLREGVDPRKAAVRLLAIWDGLQVQWLLDRESLDMADEIADHLHRILTVRLPGC
ncbi:TetR/AcrR family transcriptional regulator [Pseudactinotalea sp.]|uniref:TetR/AcrR family transcriptional regulator n=1 Tax=Pseudactinotalea sp. TaxID=1926260 RepID=UPI003B39FE48